ncbi:MAG: TonB-dependent receptor, partial [Elusimicrobiota bacterium]|nr:TonB-dependent receptor [Elusimicrobiota bacterium]
WKCQLSWKNKTANTNWTNWSWFDTRYINTLGFNPQYNMDGTIGDKKYDLTAGIDIYHSINKIDKFKTQERTTKSQETEIKKQSAGIYIDGRISPIEKFILNLGGRIENTMYEFENITGKTKEETTQQNDAIEGRIVYHHLDGSNISFSINKSFRLPKTDEYYSVRTGLNKDLKPQSALNYNASLKQKIKENVLLRLNVYHMNITNEIYYDPYLFKNKNYESTVHQGIETEIDYRPIKKFSLSANYTFTNAFFDKGDYKNKKIPLVPQDKFYLSANYEISKYLNWSISDEYIGERYFGSDQKNEKEKMSAYNVIITKLRYTKGEISIFAAINNLTNTKYSPFGYYGLYYPAPTRSFSAGIEILF